ncbi:PREDICTED: receptor-like serine/threonine-protein kinase SD1-8 [Camelina sativa]|uniref:Receptor-like serine/threonine-protein kinase n=1 Tax=Camelina sativa TaxID=90675 RepID=A0ABM0TSW8_CAMSA|nr:PREDICTED: receptor-like serine/threonine-protein kinase SD1-8 [Camelina sativa]
MMSLQRYHLCFILTWLPLLVFSTTLDNTLSSNGFLSPSNSRTIVSPGQVFELGFFKLSPDSRDGARWYLGIWYRDFPTRDYVWVANRNNPLSNPVGTLKISDANLDIRDPSNNLVWSTNLARRKTKAPVVAELLDNGNFVLRCKNRNSSNQLLWQSFDFPTDTLLPEMKLGWTKRSGQNKFLQSWASAHDPSSGDFTYVIDIAGGGLPQRVIREGGRKLGTRVDSWNGIGSIGLPATLVTANLKFDFIMHNEEITYSFKVTTNKIYSKLIIDYRGTLHRMARSPRAEDWVSYWITPTDMCDAYAACGSYGQCDTNVSPMCTCIEGFRARNKEAWTGMNFKDGCERKTPLRSNSDGFHQLKKIKLPDTKAVTVEKGLEFEECQRKCVGDFNCTAFAYVDMWNGAGWSCLIWTGELVDIRVFFSHGQDLYVRVAKTDLGNDRSISKIIIGLIVGVAGGMIFLCFVMFCFWKKKQKRSRANAVETPIAAISTRTYLSGEIEDLALSRMEFKTVVMTTENFSYALGQGGFGFVYKGRLLDGTLVAIKRLSDMSVQGTKEFETEVRLIAKLQHKNLVRLVGFCDDMGEKILIYEYLENRSLDVYIFGKNESSKLNWQKRFEITKGIAQGIQYLHQESRFRIIHRDLKASNILLDKDMIPKISDFGLARIIRNETQDNTRKVVGTFGYMAPEYWTNGVFSMKSDVFSFGVLLLEIISGKRNRGFSNLEGDTSLLTCAWRNWEEGNWLETVDPLIVPVLSSSSSTSQEVHRCLQIGLLCVQEHAADRPMMSSVVMMLGSEVPIPQPKTSGYCVRCVGKRSLETGSSSSTQPTEKSCTANQITVSVIDPR